MKKEFSESWKNSIQKRKQIKYLANAPLHIRAKLVSSNLSKELKDKYGKNSMPLRKGDEVKVMVGKFKKHIGKIEKVDLKKKKVTVENVQRKKMDGSKVSIYLNASNLQIQKLNLDDKKRLKSISRKVPEKKDSKPKLKEKKNASDKSSIK